MTKRKRHIKTKTINLALQGGGSHGAYTWGALDRLLEEDKLEIEGISGASAGAMNAIALASGFAKNGRDGAMAELARMWKHISNEGLFSPIQRTPFDMLLKNWSLKFSPSYLATDILGRLMSPYQTNPLGVNPLRIMLHGMIDFEAVKACQQIKLFVSATSVRTGKPRFFRRDEINADVLAASSCLPTMYQSVIIDGEAYWDGGYMGNPMIWPLIYECNARDVVLIQVNPITRDEVPRTAPEINNRINEIAFNASLVSEMRAMDFVARLLDEGVLDPKKYKKMLMHRIHSEGKMDQLDASSKVNAEWEFLRHLHKTGYNAADNWLRAHWSQVGEESSLDIRANYL